MTCSTGSPMPTAHVALTSAPAGERRRRRPWRQGIIALAVLLVTLVGLWVGVHRLPWLGPWLSDNGRKVLGDRAVATLEDWTYTIDDAWNRLWRGRERPQRRWQVPAFPHATSVGAAAASRFHPADVGPVHERFAAPGDGAWVPVLDERHPDLPPLMYKALLHPDERRAWAELFVVAIARPHVRLRLVAGTVDPEATTAEGKVAHRHGLIPQADQDLLAAFNGGFKTEHGHFGMQAEGVTLIPPRAEVCTVAALDDESLRIATWPALSADEPRMLWWRQTPPCMVERGVMHTELLNDSTRRWGAAVGGETVIRRSAIGLDDSGDVLYVGVSEATTAGTLAQGMRHAGPSNVAELDVNWSYPKFVVFRTTEFGAVQTVGLFLGFVFEQDEYVRRPAPKDFFYVLHR
jgi:hypothetical protein